MISPSFMPAKWRSTTKADGCEEVIGLAFDQGDKTVRLRLSLADAKQLKESLEFYLSVSLSPISAGMPNRDGSMPLGQ